MKAKALNTEKLRADLRQAALDRAQAQEQLAKTYQEQSWQKGGRTAYDSDPAVDGDDAAEDDGSDAEGEPDEVDEDFYCAACEKGFQSIGAWENHERSKKHTKLVEQCVAWPVPLLPIYEASPRCRLKRQLRDEDEDFGLSASTELPAPTTDDTNADDDDVVPLPQAVESEDEQTRPKLGKKGRRKNKPTKAAEERPQSASLADLDIASEVATPSAAASDDDEAATPSAEPQISKKDKRRAKEAAKKAAAATAQQAPAGDSDASGKAEACNVCSEVFPSRGKLFTHIKSSGHALAASPGRGDGKIGTQREMGGKRKGKR